jgi:hypothetical protein
MKHHDRLQAVREGSDYKAPLRAINEQVEGIVHCGLIVRQHEEGCPLTPEVRALDAIGTQVERELRQRAEMIRALVDRCNVLETFVRDARAKGYITDPEVIETLDMARERAIMPEQRGTLHMAEQIPA